MLTIGIDPGKSGAIAFLSSADSRVYDMPLKKIPGSKKKEIDLYKLQKILKECFVGSADIYMEKVHAMPSQGVTSMFSFGRTVGRIEGILSCLSDNLEYVTPQAWKKHFDLIKQPKIESVLLAREKFPHLSDKLLKSKDGRAEALLIALYGREIKKAEG